LRAGGDADEAGEAGFEAGGGRVVATAGEAAGCGGDPPALADLAVGSAPSGRIATVRTFFGSLGAPELC
jgi:hypothetical protein